MSFDPRKHAIDEHKRWIGYLQPEGIVVSPVALVDHGAQLDASLLAPIQERLLAALEVDAETGAPLLPSFPFFARAFLNWRDDLLSIFSVDAEVPDALRVSTGEYCEVLRPDAALRHLAPPDAARPWMILVRQLAPGTKLDAIPEEDRAHGWVASPAQKFERLLRATEVPIGIIANGTEVRLVYAPRGENAGSLTFPVRFMTELPGRALAAAFEMLLSHRRLISVAEPARLPALLRKSREYQGAVSSALAEQVLEALYELVRGFQAADSKVHGNLLRDVLSRDPDEVYHAILTVLLRLVFLLFAEDRGLMPGGTIYQRNYAVHGLFERLRAAHERYPDTMESRYGAWAQILTLCRVVHDGCRHNELRMPARQGHLFDPNRFPFLEGRSDARANVRDPENQLPLVSDGTLFNVLEKLLILDGERLSYRTLDVEQIGSVYQTMIGFSLQIAQGTSIALKPAKSKGAPAFLDLEKLLATEPGKRAEHLQKVTDHKLTGAASNALKAALSFDDLLAALDRKIARNVTHDRVPTGSLILQPTDERRRSGSHYTPRALTEPIVRKTLEPILARLSGGQNEETSEPGASSSVIRHSSFPPTPQQILDLKICDPAVGSGAFLVEACRQLGDALVAAWEHHGGKPFIPPDEDELLHARRLVAQRCLYGVDRNPMATDLAKLSLWLATLAKDHPFTFLDHSLRTGDALVGLGKKQIIVFHWDLTADEAKQRQFGQSRVEKAIELATSYRREILEGGDFLLPDVKAERLARADRALDEARRAGDLCIAAFFNGDKPKARAALRESYLDTLIEIQPGNPFDPEKVQKINATVAILRSERSGLHPSHPVLPFHWEIEFPEVFGRQMSGFDAFVGNPPYGGKNTVIEGNHESYLDWLKALHEESHGNADLVAHFFRRAFNLLRRDGTFGLIATNTIRQGDTRHTGLRWICTKGGGTIYAARRRYKWVGAAAVVVSVVWVAKGMLPAPFDLDGRPVSIITAYLFHDGGHENPAVLAANAAKSFQGSIVLGMGFTFDDTDKKGHANTVAEMERLIAKDPRNAGRIFPYLGGEDVNDSPTHLHKRYVINFADFPLRRDDALGGKWITATEDQRTDWLGTGIVPEDYPNSVAADWPDLMEIAEQKVKGTRASHSTAHWWHFERPRVELYSASKALNRVLVRSLTSSNFATFTFLPNGLIYDQTLLVFAYDEGGPLAILCSRTHEVWALFLGATMKDDPRYNLADCFETYPFPDEWETNAALETAGREYYEFRAALMFENHKGLTKTYNRFHDPAEDAQGIVRLRELHAAMDNAVLAAYGWSDLIESGGTLCEFVSDYYDEPAHEGGDPIPKSIRYRWPDATRDEVLARLLKLNALRAAEEKAIRAPIPKPAKKAGKLKAPKAGISTAPELDFGTDLFPRIVTTPPLRGWEEDVLELPSSRRHGQLPEPLYYRHWLHALFSLHPGGITASKIFDSFRLLLTRDSRKLISQSGKKSGETWRKSFDQPVRLETFIVSLYGRATNGEIEVTQVNGEVILTAAATWNESPSAWVSADVEMTQLALRDTERSEKIISFAPLTSEVTIFLQNLQKIAG